MFGIGVGLFKKEGEETGGAGWYFFGVIFLRLYLEKILPVRLCHMSELVFFSSSTIL